MSASAQRRKQKIKKYVIDRDGSLCVYCEKVLSFENVTLDHIVCDSKNGTFNTTNLTVACEKCNQKRGNKPFFNFCKRYKFSKDKLDKYKRLYHNNLRIKVLNIAKEKFLIKDSFVPNDLISLACDFLHIKLMNFIEYEKIYNFSIKFNEISNRKDIKFSFEELIRIIEADSV